MHSTMYNGIKMAKKITHDCGQKSIDSVTWTRKFYECVSNRYKFVTLIKKIIFKIEFFVFFFLLLLFSFYYYFSCFCYCILFIMFCLIVFLFFACLVLFTHMSSLQHRFNIASRAGI
jgi:hypothetical protein